MKKYLLATSDYGNKLQEDLNAIVGHNETFNNAIVRHALDLKDYGIMQNPNPLNATLKDIKKFDIQNPVIGKLVSQVKASKLTREQLTKKILLGDDIALIENRLEELKKLVNVNRNSDDDDDNNNDGDGGGRGNSVGGGGTYSRNSRRPEPPPAAPDKIPLQRVPVAVPVPGTRNFKTAPTHSFRPVPSPRNINRFVSNNKSAGKYIGVPPPGKYQNAPPISPPR